MYSYSIDGIDITNRVLREGNIIQREGLILGYDILAVPDKVTIFIDNSTGDLDGDGTFSTWGRYNDGYGKVLEIDESQTGLFLWAGWVEDWIMNDSTGEIEITAINYASKLRNFKVENWSYTGSPSQAIQTLLETKAGLSQIWVDQIDFTNEIAYDNANNLSVYINVAANETANCLDLLNKISMIFGKRLKTYRNVISIDHEYIYAGGTGTPINDGNIILNQITRWRDRQRVFNHITLPYHNAGSLVYVNKDMTDVGYSLSEYTENLTKYGKRFWPKEKPFMIDSTGAIQMAHATSASATFIADLMVDLRHDAPLMFEFEVDQSTENLLAFWNNIRYFDVISITHETRQGIKYNSEPLEVEVKTFNHKTKKGIIKARALNLYPKRF
jgi:hypothetical protein